MKKYVLLMALTLSVLSWIAIAPILTGTSRAAVSAVMAAVAPAETTVDASGTIQTAQQQTVSYGYPVMPEEVCVKLGDTVQKGQLLLKIDRNETAAAFATIAANQALAGGSSGDTSSAAASAVQEYLDNGGDIGQLISQYSSAQNTSNTPSSSPSSSGTSSRPEADLSAQAGGLGSSLASMDLPEDVYASVSGVVTKINAGEGTFTQPTVPLVVVSDTNRMQVKAQVDESLISSVKTGQPVRVSGDAFGGILAGTVSQISPTAHTVMTGTITTKAVVDVLVDISGSHDSVKSGMSADVSIVTSNHQEIALPYEAVQQDGRNQLYVLTVQAGRVRRRNIVAGAEHSDTVAVQQGVNPGDIVILNPGGSLRNGQPVKVTLSK